MKIDNYDYTPELLTLAVKEVEGNGYLVLGYEDGRIVKVPVDELMEAAIVAEPHEPMKTITNHTKGLRVMFADGTVICNKTAIDTEIDVFRRIGFERVERVGRTRAGWPLVGKKKRPVEKGKIWQHESDRWYIYGNTNNEQKKEDLQAISDFYHLGLRISDGKPEK